MSPDDKEASYKNFGHMYKAIGLNSAAPNNSNEARKVKNSIQAFSGFLLITEDKNILLISEKQTRFSGGSSR